MPPKANVRYGVSRGDTPETVNVVLSKTLARDVVVAITNGADRGPGELHDERMALDFARSLQGFTQ